MRAVRFGVRSFTAAPVLFAIFLGLTLTACGSSGAATTKSPADVTTTVIPPPSQAGTSVPSSLRTSCATTGVPGGALSSTTLGCVPGGPSHGGFIPTGVGTVPLSLGLGASESPPAPRTSGPRGTNNAE